jgi:hypothetical protein
VTYVITPKTFGRTNRLQLLLGLGTLACFVLPMIFFPLIRPSWAWTSREMVTGLLTWLFIEFWWYVQHNYSLEVDEDSVRVVGGRVAPKRPRSLLERVQPLAVARRHSAGSF